MIKKIVGVNWNGLNGQIRSWWDKNKADQAAQLAHQRAQKIEILQKRYGYTLEKATSELDKHYSKVSFS